ncbi:MAG: HipA domain-containing protein [Betaproteobacteria bacterium]|nr:HipA domain-containing protein [Betaproteobacteria bacterium]
MVSGRHFHFDGDDDPRISIAGAQEKTALLHLDGQWFFPRGATPTTHILKLPLGTIAGGRIDFSSSVENEWLCLKLAKACGFNVPKAEIVTFGPYKALVVERFDRLILDDREPGRWIARLPQEDMCQAKGIPPFRKYERDGGPGMAEILDTLRGSETNILDRASFLGAQMFFWMLAAPDGHAKNFSVFIEPKGLFRATPLYDVMSAWPIIGHAHDKYDWKKIEMAMAVRSGRDPHHRMAEVLPRHWMQFAERHAVTGFSSLAGLIVAGTRAAISEVSRLLPVGFPQSVSDPVFAGLERQADVLAPLVPGISIDSWLTEMPAHSGLAGPNFAKLDLVSTGP